MKTLIPPEDLPASVSPGAIPQPGPIDVRCCPAGGMVAVLLSHAGEESATLVEFEPDEALKMWRCLSGKDASATPRAIDGRHYGVWHSVVPVHGDMWYVGSPEGQKICCLDREKALAMAWAVKRCVEDAVMCQHASIFRHRRPCVWVLTSRRMLTGDCAENGSDQLGGCERVFASRDLALKSLFGFLVPIVKECRPDGAWDSDPDTTVDDEVSRIITEAKGDVWRYDGTTQSFEVTLAKVEVEHGAV